MAETVLNGILDQNIDIDIIISAVSEKYPIMVSWFHLFG